MQLVIAEKPSVARDLARVLGAKTQGRGAYEGGGRVITWCVGHLVELDEPAAYDGRWKAWRLDTLPMLPPEFKLRPSKHGADQLRHVVALLRERRFESVVNACDAGREGELIFRYVYQYAGGGPPVLRLWISSLTDDAIRRGFAELKPGAQFDALGDAARARSEADWLVGMNATRAVTLRLRGAAGGALFSIGRVQTPTLAMLVAREHAIAAFVPRDYWEVQAALTTAGGERFSARWSSGRQARLGRAELAASVVARCSAQKLATDDDGPRVERVRSRTVHEPAPQLFDLTSLQRTANRRFGWSAQHTLDLAQALYEKKKVLTYPRTDSRHLTTDVAKELPSLIGSLAGVADYAPFAAQLTAQPPRPGRRVVDDSKVQDHHAIIPTGKVVRLDDLDRDERRLFDLVARRFLGVFFPDAEFAVTEALIRIGAGQSAPPESSAVDEGEPHTTLPPPPDWFVTRGRVRVQPGWQAVAGIDGSDEAGGDPESAILPPLVEGQRLDAALQSQAKKTLPPRRYSEAALLSAMELAGRALTDEALRAAMKDTGLGTPATRAAIIETLLKRSYVTRDKRHLVPTATGMGLIDALPVQSLASPELTGEWEARLARVARRQESRERFMADIGEFVRETVAVIRASRPATGLPAAPAARVGRCPLCGKAVVEGARAFACESCAFAMQKMVAGRPVSAALAGVLLSQRRSQKLAGFRSKGGRRFAAALVLDDDGSVRFDFDGAGGVRKTAEKSVENREIKQKKDKKPNKEKKAKKASEGSADGARSPGVELAELPCPRCRVGRLLAGRRGWGCGRWREGCSFVVWFETAGRRLTEAQLRDLVLRGKTRKVRWSPDDAAGATARLVLDLEAPGGARLDRTPGL